MERRYSKEQILELYLNTINYGNGAYGAEAAAQTYFQVHASDLSMAQASFLAGLPQAPATTTRSARRTRSRPPRSGGRQVLDGMVSVGDICSSAANDLFNGDLIAKMIAARNQLPGSHNPRDRALRRLRGAVHRKALRRAGVV